MESHSVAIRFAAALEAVPEPLVLIDADGRIALANPEAERLFGYRRDDLVGEPVDRLIPEGFGGMPSDGGRPERVARRNDGTAFPVEIRTGTVRDGSDTLTITCVRDLTGQRRAEARQQAIFEAGPDAVVVVDRGGRIVLVNARLEQLFGYRREELLDRPLDVLVPGRLRGVHGRHVGRYLSDPRPRPMGNGFELLGLRKDGSEFRVEISLSPVATAEGILVTAAIREVSARALREEQRRQTIEGQLQAESAARSTSAEMNERLILTSLREHELADAARLASEAKSRFLAAMSHELRTPLNAIAGYSGLIEEGIAGPVTDTQLGYLRKIQEGIRHLVGVIGDVLDLAKVEAGQMRVERKRGSLRDAVSQTLPLIEPQAKAARVALDPVAASPATEYEGDPDRVRQILLNLLSNAVKFTDPGGRVTVTCGETRALPPEAKMAGEGPWAFIAVTDTGVGIAPENAAPVFQPFVRVAQDMETTRVGTGLGLAISRELARRMGGDLTLRSGVGEGSCFTLWLPAHTAGDPSAA